MSPAAGAHWQSIVRGQRRRLELYKNRDEITDNEKWRQELEHLHDDCAVALYKYDPD